MKFAKQVFQVTSITLLLVTGFSTANAKPEADLRYERIISKSDVESGALLIETNEAGKYLTAPLVAADVKMDVSGPIIRSSVTQRFENPTDKWVEGVYAFPLPENSAVDKLKIIIGDRFIEGKIKERGEARRIYETAKAEGKKAGLVEQERPNLFTTSVANIGPGETVAIQIEYQDTAHMEDGDFSIRFPLVAAPRYNPVAKPVLVADIGASGFATGDPVPDRDRVSPPVMHPDAESADLRLPVVMTVNLSAGFPIDHVASDTHALKIERPNDKSAIVHFAKSEVPADRDFVLEWSPKAGNAPYAGLFTTKGQNGKDYIYAFITPPKGTISSAPRSKRETVFVIDNSGSMSGASMEQAKRALIMALARLDSEDTFNIVRFDDTLELVFEDAVPASTENIAYASRFVSQLEAEGGTEMEPALKAALQDPRPGDNSRLRQVVFITDGAIGNEAELFETITTRLGRSRLFTVGIGSAPNAYFMTRASRLGRGTFTYIDDPNEVAEETEKLFAALEQPILTDLKVSFPTGSSAAAYPDPLPDLYQGEPVSIVAELGTMTGHVTIEGLLEGAPWSQSLPLAAAAKAEGVSQVWGRAKIRDLEESRYEGASSSTVDAGVLKTALDFGLVSRLTSLVAVDITPSRPSDEPIDTRKIATMLPAGWDFGAVFGEAAENHASGLDDLPSDLLHKIKGETTAERSAREAETARRLADARARGLDLPATAEAWQLWALIGLLMIGGSFALIMNREKFLNE